MKRLVVSLLIAVALAATAASSANAHYTKVTAASQYKHAQDVLRFFRNHPSLAKTHAGRIAIKNHRWLLKEARRQLTPIWPPHHSLWLCIHSGEGGWHQPSRAKAYVRGVLTSLYWGGMQMHTDWGHGTSHHASDDSQSVQEWAAETAYRESGYSLSFLWQQWAADAHCFS